MSIHCQSWCWRQRIKPPSRKFVLICLGTHSNAEWDAWRGQIGVADETELDERTVREHMKALEDAGYIERERRSRENGSRTSDMIHIAPNSPERPSNGGSPPAGPTGEKHPSQPGLTPGPDQLVDPSGTTEVTPVVPKRQQPADAKQIVWAHYLDVMKPRRREGDPEELKLIGEALKVASADECNRAIDGCAASTFHMGKNDRDRKYNRISQILKGRRGRETTRERIDFFIDLAEKAGVAAGEHVTSGDPARVEQAKRDVIDAYELPGNDHVQEQATESEEWLKAHGWVVQRGTDGRPRFEAGS